MPVAAGASVSVAIPGLPGNASAVAVGLVGTGGTADTFRLGSTHLVVDLQGCYTR
ncbi:hypothetical protein [Amycolatopsis sp. lyj-346]|uniref:hypothetical protein n=1 Tax=Amycolatopsis sp. lyj-346 TaxID=2789289 RepID=UPI00397B1439